jgi:hypothetical protein
VLQNGLKKGDTSMRFSLKAITIAGAIIWGSVILLVGLINLAAPGYGLGFLNMTSSIYPWFHASHGVESVVIGTVDGLVDGAIGSLLFALLYNSFIGGPPHTA